MYVYIRCSINATTIPIQTPKSRDRAKVEPLDIRAQVAFARGKCRYNG